MKKILILLICFLCTSCFEITEKIKHHRDQSGEYSITVDFSKSWLKTKSAMLLEEIDGTKIPNEDEITQKLNDFKRTASKIDGISNIITTTNFDDYIFTISLNYKNVAALNAAMNAVNKQNERVYVISNNANSFERRANYPIPEKLANDPKRKSDLEQANVISIYTFDTEIATVNNASSKISKNKKSVFLKHTVYNVLKKSSLMNNSIQLTH